MQICTRLFGFVAFKKLIAAAAIAAIYPTIAHASLITDTVADYSGTQGQAGYDYGYSMSAYGTPVTPATFTTSGMAFSAGSWVGPLTSACCGGATFPVIFQNGSHGLTNPNAEGIPGDPAGPFGGTYAAGGDRQWTSTYAGPVTISGDYQAQNACCNGNQTVRVYINGVQQFFDAVGAGTLNGFALKSYSFNATLALGDKVDWISDPNLGYYGDATTLTGVISSVPEPAAFELLGLGAVAVFLLARRRPRLA